jgi:hypothetical protein
MERTEVFEKNQTAIAYPDCKNPKHQYAVMIEPDGKVAGEKGVQSGAAAHALVRLQAHDSGGESPPGQTFSGP